MTRVMSKEEQIAFLKRYQGCMFTNGRRFAILCGLTQQGKFAVMKWDSDDKARYPDKRGSEGWVSPCTIVEGEIWKEVANHKEER